MLMKKGAEANLYLEPFSIQLHPFGEGRVVVKHRVSKRYRVRELDFRLREARTSLEASLLADAKRAGVFVPTVYEVDRKNMRIVMEHVEGEQVKTVLERLDEEERWKLCRTIGRCIARLHRSGIIHGDLTTSNMVLTPDGQVYLVDFGLGEYDRSVESRGVDLHLLKRALQSVHFRVAERAYREVLSGYAREFGEGSSEVIRRVEEIERRGRYVGRENRGTVLRHRK